MTTLIQVLIVAAITAACYLVSPISANAQGPGAAAPGSVGFTLQFDENGNSLLNGGPNPFPVVPIAGGGINFYLPVPVVQGYVLVASSVDVDPAHPSGDSDLMVFFNVPLPSGQMQGVMNYASLIDPGDPLQLADVNSFTFPQPVTTIGEIGPEGNNGFTWIPDPPNAAGAMYIGISDGNLVPEPSALVLGGLGLVGLAGTCWRRLSGGALLPRIVAVA